MAILSPWANVVDRTLSNYAMPCVYVVRAAGGHTKLCRHRKHSLQLHEERTPAISVLYSALATVANSENMNKRN